MPATVFHRAGALLAGLCALTAWPGAAAAELPLGPRSLDERRTEVVVGPGVIWTHIVRGRPARGGPWRVDVLELGPAARVAGVLANDLVPGRESVSSMARRTDALAAVNGGYFGSSGVFDGDPVGVLAVGGALVSEPVAGRAALLLPSDGRPAVARLRFAGSVAVEGRRRLLDGVDRAQGLIPACGGRGRDRPTQRADSGLICSDASELLLRTPAWGRRTPAATGGVEAVMRRGAVTEVRRAGGTRIPTQGYVLTGTGEAARFLREVALPGSRPRVRLAVRAGGRTRRPSRYDTIVGGGPRLLRGGEVRVQVAAEGFSADFAARHPRTLVGVGGGGRLLLVTVDGRDPRRSVGVTLTEAARVMRALGARAALNLDGGGSTTMSVDGAVVNRPSDGLERSVSDALVVLPGG